MSHSSSQHQEWTFLRRFKTICTAVLKRSSILSERCSHGSPQAKGRDRTSTLALKAFHICSESQLDLFLHGKRWWWWILGEAAVALGWWSGFQLIIASHSNSSPEIDADPGGLRGNSGFMLAIRSWARLSRSVLSLASLFKA